MTDAELIEFAAEFREGILGDRPSEMMCAAVSWPLASLLRVSGVDCEAINSELSEKMGFLLLNHVWIRLADGRALDPTADQFNRFGFDFPPVYLGEPAEIHDSESLMP